MKTVFKVRVITNDVLSDFGARLKSIVGGRVKGYEQAIKEGLESAYAELLNDFPNIKNIKMGTTEMIKDGAEIIIYGDVTDEEYEAYKKKQADSD